MKTVISAVLQPWQKVGQPQVLAKKFNVSVGIQLYVNPNTGEQEEHSFFTKQEGVAVCCLTHGGDLVLVRQFKQAANGMVIEFPAGIFKQDENVTTAALNEVLQETGYVPSKVVLLPGKTLLAPRKSPSGEWSAVATGCVFTGKQNLDAGEAGIEVLEVSVEEFWTMVARGEILSAPTILAATKAALAGHITFHPPA